MRERSGAIRLKAASDIEAMARSGKIISALFVELEPRVVPGATTRGLNRLVEDFVTSWDGAACAFKGLYGFPAGACISVNAEVVHGIPRRRRLRAGDIVSIDVGVERDGWCADSAFTFPVGEVSPAARRLMRVTRDALDCAVAAAQPGSRVGDIGAAVVRRVAPTGLGIIRDLVGHGVGREVHEEPQVPNIGRRGQGALLQPGTVLAIEPMLAAGTDQVVTRRDGWTVATADGSLAAHYEHTVAVTATGPRVLTGGGLWDRTIAANLRGCAVNEAIPGSARVRASAEGSVQ